MDALAAFAVVDEAQRKQLARADAGFLPRLAAGGGFQLGPAVGAVLADLVRDGRSDTPIDAFSVSRFAPGPRAASATSAPASASAIRLAATIIRDSLSMRRNCAD